MPRADGTIVPTVVPSVPWLERFKVDSFVRVAKGVEDYGGIVGVVVEALSDGDYIVALDPVDMVNKGIDPDGHTTFIFSPGELRRLES